MSCAACGHENPARAKFCLECGAALAARCASCGTELPPAAKFCLECGARTAAAAAPPSAPAAARDAGARKVVTILFADLAGSTALQERLDAESTSAFMDRYYAAMRAAVAAHGGTVVKLLGDGVMVAFGVPRVAEDDALRAVRAGVAMQQAFRTLAADALAAAGDIGLRIAVNTGEVVVNADHTDLVGDPVNVAARLQQEAGDGEVVLGEATQRLVASLVTLELLGSVALKGRSEAVKAYRVVSLERPQGAAAAAFVGRDEELARLSAVYQRAVARPEGALVVLLGSPGLGKSRLIDEFARRHGAAATIVTAHCDAAGGATFAPLAQALRELLAIEDGAGADALRAAIEGALPGDDGERGRIAGGIAALLTGSPASPEETFFVVRRFLAGLAQARPVVLVIDDLHWAEPLLLDLIEHLVQWGAGLPLFVLVGARPELRDLRSSLVTPGGLVADVITLAGLDAGAAMRLAANVIGAADLPAAAAAKVLATSEGNPLFVGELVRMLVQEGALTKEGERWTIGAGLAALEMPPTIHALLAARIERLRPDERSVLERAAVVGRHFSRSAVAALLPRGAGDLDARLESLRRSELIERDTGWLLGEPVLRFHHVLIRDAAYRRLLKGTRAELHERLADWIEAQVGEAPEHDETIGWHLEQAHQLRRELGPLDAGGRTIGERAASRLAAAGRRALARDDLPLAAGLLGRAIDRLDAADPMRADLALDWCEALLAAGDVGPAAKAIDELARFLPEPPRPTPSNRTTNNPTTNNRASRLTAWHTCFAGQLMVLTAPQALQGTADAVAAAADALAALDDAAGEAKAHSVHAQALARLGKVGACESALDRALAAARRAGDRRRANAVLAGAPVAALWGPSPVTRASGRCLDVVRVLRITQGAPAVEAVALSCQGVLEALRGRTDAARRMIASSRKMVEELGIAHRLLEADVFAGRIDLLEGDAVAAERGLRGAYAGLRELGLGIDAARAAALLARALLAQGRAADAEALSHESELLAGDDLQAAIAWRGVRAEALAQRGEHAAAIELAQAAVTIAAATDALLDHADARLALAAALRAAGRSGEADAEKHRATELWETKGATLLAGRMQRDETRAEAMSRPGARIEPTRAMRRRVRANAATASVAEVDAAFASRSIAAIEAVVVSTAGVRVVDHPTESTYGHEGAVESFRRLLRLKDPVVRHEPLATLGESLGLFRRRISTGGSTGGRFDVADFEREEFVVSEPGVLIEIFAADRLGAAIARLYERFAELCPAPGRTRAAATARSVAAMTGLLEHDRMASAVAPAIEVVDHRILGTWSARGAEGLLAHVDAWLEVGDAHSGREDDVLDLRADALVVRRTFSGTDREGGGAFDGQLIVLCVFGKDGRATHWEMFESDREAEALARFDAFSEDRSPATANRPFANAAIATVESVMACMRAHDWQGFARLFADDFHMSDRRRVVQLELDREQYVAFTREVADGRSIRARSEDVATRGERLALTRSVYEFADAELGPSEIAFLILTEVDDRGRIVAYVRWDVDDLDAAYAEIDARWAGGEATVCPRAAKWLADYLRCFAARDWTAMAALFAPDLVGENHRLVGWGTRHGPAGVVSTLQAQIDLAQDTQERVDHVRTCEHAVFFEYAWHGTREGGAFENLWIVLVELDADGRARRADVWEAAQLEQARARFGEIASRRVPAASSPGRFPNAATRSLERQQACFHARDWRRFADLLPAAFRYTDRRAMVQLELDRNQYVAFIRPFGDMASARLEVEVVATRGDCLALARLRFEGAGGDVGSSVVEHLNVIEMDEHGEFVARVRFDTGDAEAAYGELEARWATGEGATHALASKWVADYGRYFAARDWNAMAAIMAADLVSHSHRLVSWGTVHGPAGLVSTIQVQMELAPDTQLRIDHLRTCARGALLEYTWHGTREGGAFENVLIAAIEIDGRGQAVRVDVWEAEHLEPARARFAQLARSAAPTRRDDSVRIVPNAASRVRDLVNDAVMSRDWDAMRALASDELVFEDRRRWSMTSGGVEMWLNSSQTVLSACGVALRDDVIAAFGERIELRRRVLTGVDPDGGGFESELLMLTEIDAVGKIVASINFDVEALAGAYVEAEQRCRAGEAVAAGGHQRFSNAATRALDRGTAALGARDWNGFASLFAAGFRVYDRTSMAQFETDGPTWLAAFRDMVEMTSGRPTQRVLATRGERLALFRVLWRGAAGDIGPSEVDWLLLIEVDDRGDHLTVVSFNPDDLDAAYAELDARWEAGEGAQHAPAATRGQQFREALDHRDWDAVVALYAPTSVAYDHRLVGWGTLRGPSVFVKTLQAMFALAPDARVRVDHVRASRRGLIMDSVWVGTRDGGAFESPFISVVELDEGGQVQRQDFYDAHHLDAARARFAEIAGASPDPLAAIAQGNAATAALDRWQLFAGGTEMDWAALRASYSPTMIFEDRQGFARLSGDREMTIASLRERVASGARAERRLLGTAGERVAITRMLWSGGPSDGRFEIEYLSVVEVDESGLVAAIILFGADDARGAQREAWARWAAIDPAVAATVTLVAEANDAFNAQDRVRLRALFADDLMVEDHRRTGMGRVEGGGAYTDSLVVLWDLTTATGVELGWFWLAHDPHGGLYTIHRSGDVAGGGAFESDYLMLIRHARGRLTHVELFELEQRDAALARFEALRAQVPPAGDP